ncbi:DUF393 domain-containing protein [bacterium SCSIO 12643]|nr:DUF393 domain-containing protein [bacterium SCSIO 12643]
MASNENQNIIFFDGYCGLCNKSVDWIIQKDNKQIFKYAPIQGPTAKSLNISSPDQSNYETIIYFDHGQTYSHSTAILHITKKLPFPWKLLSYFIFIPTIIRDSIYRFISKNRYRWFGQLSTCRIPQPHEKEFFLD